MRVDKPSRLPLQLVQRNALAPPQWLSVPTVDRPIDWEDADPIEGVELPSGPLPLEELKEVFGRDIHQTPAAQLAYNWCLSLIQYRRLSGMLVDAGVAYPGDPNHPRISHQFGMKALEYLRATFPFDEETAAQRWAEREAQRLETELVERGEKIGIYQPVDAPDELQGTPEGRARYGPSGLDAIKAEYDKTPVEEYKPKFPQGEVQGGELEPVGKTGWLVRREKSEWLKRYEEKAAASDFKEENVGSVMSTFSRIWPSALVVAAVLALVTIASQYYEPPSRAARLFPGTPPAAATIFTLIGINLTVFCLWRIPPLWRFMNTYFYIVPGYPRALSMVGAMFSHQSFTHLALNMVHEDVGRANFLAIYLASGVVGSLASLSFFVALRAWAVYSLGSSGAGCGIVAALCLINPRQNLTPIFLPDVSIPISTTTLLALLVAGDVILLARRGVKSNIDHVGHIGGYIGGVLSWWVLKQRGDLGRRRSGADVAARRSFFPKSNKDHGGED
ncbi:hypothetical protein B0A49_09499 [Cryomyces minteri]|uniref:Peptidase S54 rhomboid domain-containing protein n=1 Tax=Cryomyces minteri TaxID=331657 RepID=A0A4U0W467_9PEZI|nr:hypothetical protein B0A49_09499 [Cryomyces minteri]